MKGLPGSKLGLVQVYTGEGKGKTTAAIGQGIRGVGAGYKVIMFSFLKNPSSEFLALARLAPQFTVILANRQPRRFYWELSPQEKENTGQDHREAWLKAEDIVAQRECDILILDEIIPVVGYGMVAESALLAIMQQCRKTMIELILTGRNMSLAVGEAADLITEMKEIKHPMRKGIKARRGIEY